MSFQRLRTDFQFGIVTVFGAIAVLCITPFAAYRFAMGQHLIGTVDLIIVGCIVAGMMHAWRGGNVHHIGIAVVVTSTLGCLAAVATAGATSVPWIYVLLVANFLIVDRRHAVAFSAIAVAGIVVLKDAAFQTSLQLIVFVMTALVVCGFAFVFAYRTQTQRLRLEALASHDPLTGAYNRRAMEHELQIAVESMRRDRVGAGLAVLDLDHFKRINDNYGHEAGDRVLVDFATLVSLNTRKADRLFRLGGEEFVLLLQNADDAALRTLSEALRGTIASQLRCGNNSITVSIGVASLAFGESVAEWLARADAAMYEAKHEGRNRVVVAAKSCVSTPAAQPAAVAVTD